MKIGFDVSQTGLAKAGCGFFAENLIHHLAGMDADNHYVLYPTFGNHYWDTHSQATCQINAPNFQTGLKHSSMMDAKKFWQQPAALIEKKLGDVDILHANNFFCPPKLPRTRLVYTLYDLSFLEHPECTTEHNRIACFEGVLQASLHADLIISISHYSREHFLQVFPHFPAERIVVAHPASRFDAKATMQKAHKLRHLHSQQFWLHVGTIEPRKNIKRLLQAYAKLRMQQPETHPLVLAGKQGWMEDDVEQLIKTLNLQNHVRLLGYVENEELQWLYQHCFCLVYPSLFEGFGLPILEAMSYGAPVITSHVSSIPEVVGEAGLLINPEREDEIVQAMVRVATDDTYRAQIKLSAIEQANLFSWHNTAKITLQNYREVLALPKRQASPVSTEHLTGVSLT